VRVTCKAPRCGIDSPAMPVMTRRAASQHHLQRHAMQDLFGVPVPWKRISSSLVTIIQESNLDQTILDTTRKELHDVECWLCSHCSARSSKTDIHVHCTEKHGISEPEEPMDYCWDPDVYEDIHRPIWVITQKTADKLKTDTSLHRNDLKKAYDLRNVLVVDDSTFNASAESCDSR